MEIKQPMPSKNIALIDFHREKGDEIIAAIAKELKEHLMQKLGKDEELEIEAKIGLIMPSKDIDPLDPFYSIFYSSHGLIMPEQKWHNKNLYYFTPGITKEKFDLLIQIFIKEWERRNEGIPKDLDQRKLEWYKQEYWIVNLGEKKTIDRMFKDGVRCTYNQNNELLECLRKGRKKHINFFNKGRDFRISIATETKCEASTSQEIVNTRHKRRHSFQFKWMKFEFTETVEEDFNGDKGPANYEVELEITNTKYFNQPDYLVYLKLVERFVQNINWLLVASNEGEEMFFDSFCQPEYDKAYKEAYETDVTPIVGDYLATKAFMDKMT